MAASAPTESLTMGPLRLKMLAQWSAQTACTHSMMDARVEMGSINPLRGVLSMRRQVRKDQSEVLKEFDQRCGQNKCKGGTGAKATESR